MNRIAKAFFLLFVGFVASRGAGQEPQKIKEPDERYKVDILVVVAHPDDEAAVTPYLARAIYDLHKNVAVVFGTRGGSGGNDYGREHGPAMADVREMRRGGRARNSELTKSGFSAERHGFAKCLKFAGELGHGEKSRRTCSHRPPHASRSCHHVAAGIFIGEITAIIKPPECLPPKRSISLQIPSRFRATRAAPPNALNRIWKISRRGNRKRSTTSATLTIRSNLLGTDLRIPCAKFRPSQKKPYWLLALRAAEPHLTQFPDEIHRWSSLSDEDIQKAMSDPSHLWWSEPETTDSWKIDNQHCPF